MKTFKFSESLNKVAIQTGKLNIISDDTIEIMEADNKNYHFGFLAPKLGYKR